SDKFTNGKEVIRIFIVKIFIKCMHCTNLKVSTPLIKMVIKLNKNSIVVAQPKFKIYRTLLCTFCLLTSQCEIMLIENSKSDRFNHYRISTPRLIGWNYANASPYFITICTKDRVNYFGKIVSDRLIPTTMGKIVESEWRRTFDMRTDMNLEMDKYVIMPNHFHAIVIIGINKHNQETHSSTGNKIGPQSNNLPAIVRGFKGSVTSYARLHHLPFAWQPRYHEHIIKDDASYRNIAEYIENNPVTWSLDKFFSP
ncbi:REP element-mobilizing transposase RayT, partial [Chitinophaga jiangningensis]